LSLLKNDTQSSVGGEADWGRERRAANSPRKLETGVKEVASVIVSAEADLRRKAKKRGRGARGAIYPRHPAKGGRVV